MAVTYSSGVSGINKEIVTTDLHHKCTMKHTGTSAAAPLAAGKSKLNYCVIRCHVPLTLLFCLYVGTLFYAFAAQTFKSSQGPH